MTIRGGHYRISDDIHEVGPIGATSCQSPSELCLTGVKGHLPKPGNRSKTHLLSLQEHAFLENDVIIYQERKLYLIPTKSDHKNIRHKFSPGVARKWPSKCQQLKKFSWKTTWSKFTEKKLTQI
uniref:Uncharacterized protein n=1 Tax=Strigamia maritima TaxID=126957 RepID=T1IZW6_STRMM